MRAGCKNPHKCSELARMHLGRLHRKWNPNMPTDLRLLEEEEKAWLDEEGRVLFDLDLTTKGSLSEGFRVFTKNGGAMNNEIDYSCDPKEN